MAIKLPSYLHRNRHGVFGFRVVIPRDLRVCFGATEYRITLKTAEKRLAKRLASGLAIFTATRFEKIRKMRNQAPNSIYSDFLSQLDEERQRLVMAVLDEAGANTPEEQQAAIAEIVNVMPEGPLKGLGAILLAFAEREETIEARKRELVAKALKTIADNPEIDPDSLFSDLYAEAGGLKNEEAELRAEIDRHRALMRELYAEQAQDAALEEASTHFAKERDSLAEFASQIIAKTSQKGLGSVSEEAGVPTPSHGNQTDLAALVGAYCENQVSEGCWTEKTEQENKAIYELWLRIVGNQLVRSYGIEQHRNYKTKLQKLPSNLNKIARYRSLSIDEVIALGDTPVASSTVGKSLTRIAALFKWAVGYGFTTINPTGSIGVKKTRRASEERQTFTDDELLMLFHSSEYLDGQHQSPYKYWIPLIGLYTGARLNEIAQLHVTDLMEVDGIRIFSINKDGKSKRLKTAASKRYIPIHSELIRLGLLTYVDNLRDRKEVQLFPELKPDRDGHGQAVSKWFGRYRKRCGVVDSGKVFHSFRHTVVDRLKQAEVPKEKIAALVGHEDESITFGRYGKDFRPSVLQGVVETLSFRFLDRVPKW